MKKLGLLLLIVGPQSFAAQTVIWSHGLLASRPSFDVNYIFDSSDGYNCYVGPVEGVCPLVETAVKASGYSFADCSVSGSEVLLTVGTDQTVQNGSMGSCR
jgi:hypothetical protein